MRIIDKIIVDNVPPKDVNVLWNDTSEDQNGILKQFVNGEWRKLKAIAQDNSINADMIKSSAVTSAKIASNAVTAAKIKNGEVGLDDMAATLKPLLKRYVFEYEGNVSIDAIKDVFNGASAYLNDEGVLIPFCNVWYLEKGQSKSGFIRFFNHSSNTRMEYDSEDGWSSSNESTEPEVS